MQNVFLEYPQASVGFTALLAVFPLCLAQKGGGRKKDNIPDPLLSGSVCPVRDSLDFLDVSELNIFVYCPAVRVYIQPVFFSI